MTDGNTGVTPHAARKGVVKPVDRTVCGLRDVLDRVGDTWSVMVTVQLRVHGPLRFGQLLRSVEGISQRMLTVTLRRLQRDGLVSRTVLDTSPPHVMYALTPVGTSLTDVLKRLVAWSAENRDHIEHSRQDWDARVPGESGPKA